MRWDTLFGDLEAQLSAMSADELDAEVAERVRMEVAALSMADRLRGHVGNPLDVRLVGGVALRGTVCDVGADVCLLREESGRHVLVPLRAMAMITGLGRAARPEASAVLRTLGFRHALRGLSRERQQVRLLTSIGDVRGLIDRVGADHVDIRTHRPGDAAGPGWMVPLDAVVAVWPDVGRD